MAIANRLTLPNTLELQHPRAFNDVQIWATRMIRDIIELIIPEVLKYSRAPMPLSRYLDLHVTGAMLGKLEVEGGGDVSSFTDPNARNLVSEVSITEPRVFGKGNPVKVGYVYRSASKWPVPHGIWIVSLVLPEVPDARYRELQQLLFTNVAFSGARFCSSQ